MNELDKLDKFFDDCKEYKGVMHRMNVLGASNDQEAILLLNRECEQYRDKIKALEKLVDEISNPVFIPAQESEVKNIGIESLPEDMRDRVYMIEVNEDGTTRICFCTGGEERKRKNIA